MDAVGSHVKLQVRNSLEDDVRGGADGDSVSLCFVGVSMPQHTSGYVYFVGVSQDTIHCLLRGKSRHQKYGPQKHKLKIVLCKSKGCKICNRGLYP